MTAILLDGKQLAQTMQAEIAAGTFPTPEDAVRYAIARGVLAGALATTASELRPDGKTPLREVIGIDATPGMIELARERAQRIGADTRFQVGTAESTSPTVQTILNYPDMGLRVQTDGNTDFDQSVVVRNTTANQTLALNGDSGGANIPHGATATLSKGTALLDSQPDELLVIIQNLQVARDEVLLDCHFPSAGSVGGTFTFCTGVRMDR